MAKRRARPRRAGAPRTVWPRTIPELTTGRLRLRAPLPRDAGALLEILGESEVTRYLNVSTFRTLARARAEVARLRRRFAARDTIRWAIELRETGEVIGTIGLLRFDFAMRHAEVGYEIGRRWWGRGRAPEAAAGVLRYGFTVLGLHRIEAGVLPDNAGSVRVLEKLGFVEEGTRRGYLQFKGRFHDFRWFSRLATDARPSP
jgi:ribosomal-protein-alanine N-acetyltransferase